MTAPYKDSYAHLMDELAYLDTLIEWRIQVFQAEHGVVPERATVRHAITHEEVDGIMAANGAEAGVFPAPDTRKRHEIDARINASLAAGVYLALPQLVQLFNLSPLEMQAFVICLAPELDRKYDRLYAYLQDDITRKRPSVDLILDLLCRSQRERWQVRRLFTPAAPLLQTGLIHATQDAYSPSGSSGLAQFLQLDPRILNYVLVDHAVDATLIDIVRLVTPSVPMDAIIVEDETKAAVTNLVLHHRTESHQVALHLHGDYGSPRLELAQAVCGLLGRPLLVVASQQIIDHDEKTASLLRRVFREGLLLQAAVYLADFDSLMGQGGAIIPQLAQVMRTYGWLTFLEGGQHWQPQGELAGIAFASIALPVPSVALREHAWTRALEPLLPDVDPGWVSQLARQFRMTPGQIADAVVYAHQQHVMHGGAAPIHLGDLFSASRQQSNQRLRDLAVKITPYAGWDDIVLPPDDLDHLWEISQQVAQRHRVMVEWGFERKLPRGAGLSALFSGKPGTGKSLAAEVIAGELGLDLYKIDLSSVVSKYIGETEKNLSKIFAEAETSNAILFFDEADALFGKRTEVSDAHDRYANIETSYLLQRIDEYGGMVILATNLRDNIDAAFVRRIRFIVEFPFPDADSRAEIWRRHFPPAAPLDADLDYGWLAAQLPIAGGSIKNIVLNAAYVAAAEDQPIAMRHILHAARREYQKIGKLWQVPSFTAYQ